MGSATREGGGAALWEVVRCSRPTSLDGVAMAGFRARGVGLISQRAVPHPAVTLVVEFGGGNLVVDHGAGRQQRGSLVAGLGFGGVRMRGERIECVEVRLSPVVAYRVLGTSSAELDGAVVALDDVWGRDAGRIRERLHDASVWAHRFASTETLLASRWSTGPPVNPEVVWVWDQIVHSRGLARVEDLAAEVGWSRRRLWSRFRSQVGLPPKQAAKLIRFDRAARRLAAGERPAQVAAESGYADQSHLHRDVQAFTGATPSIVAAEPTLAVDDIAWTSP